MAWRNVWRNRRRTLVTISAMTLALLVMILYSALMEGYLRDMESSVLDLEVGDVQVFAGDYRDNPSIYTRIEDPDGMLRELDAAGLPASPRLLAYGMAAAGESSAGVSFRGLDVSRDARVSRVHEQLASGSWIAVDDPSGVVLGRRLAKTLAVAPGSEILVLSQGADGSMAYDKYRVRGVLHGIGDMTDRTGVFMTADAFRELFVVPDGVHQIIVRRGAELSLPEAAVKIQQLAGDNEVKTWRQLLPTVSSMLDSARGAMVAMSFIIYLAVAILILNAMLMAVFERLREIGVLKALGVGPFEVFRLMFVEAGIQAGIAIAVGTALSVPGMWYLMNVGIDFASLAGVSVMGVAMTQVWRAALTAAVYSTPILMLVGIVLAAVIYPALKAALIRPIVAMRQQ